MWRFIAQVHFARGHVHSASQNLGATIRSKINRSDPVSFDDLNTLPRFKLCHLGGDRAHFFERAVQRLRACGFMIAAETIPSLVARYAVVVVFEDRDLHPGIRSLAADR